MKLDPYNHKERYLKWKEEVEEAGCVEDISKANSDLTLRYIFDMEVGLNVSIKSVKGPRSHIRLNNLKQRMIFLSKRFEEYYGIESLTDLTETQVVTYFAKVRSGEIRKIDGGVYKSVIDFVQIFKSFWHWHMKVCKKQGVKILDITEELDCSKDKPEWVYLTEAQVRKMCDKGKHKYKVLIMFLFDTGIRAPTELMNIKVSDFYDDFKELNIRNEIAKKRSFGRKIKLMLCSDLIRDFVKETNLEKDDYVFQICPTVVNRYLKRLAKRLFGDEKTFGKYLKIGGFPEYIKIKKDEILQNLFSDIISRDIIVRYNIRNSKILYEMAVYLLSNISKEFSYNNIKKMFELGSVNTVSAFVSYLEDSYVVFTLPKFSYSLKQQQVSNKKVYSIDNAFARINSLNFSENKGQLIENQVFLELRQRYKDIFYFQIKHECDFIIKEKTEITQAIQVCYELNRESREREIQGLVEAMDNFKLKKGLILTNNQEDKIVVDKKKILVKPMRKWLLE